MSKRLQRTSRRNFEPSIGVVGVMRIACCVFVAVVCSLVGAASASAGQVQVLGKDGRLTSREDPALGALTMKAPPRRAAWYARRRAWPPAWCCSRSRRWRSG